MIREHTVIVEHRQPEYVKHLQRKILTLTADVQRLKMDLLTVTNKYGYEVMLNDELIDLLRENQIPFRPLLSRKERERRENESMRHTLDQRAAHR